MIFLRRVGGLAGDPGVLEVQGVQVRFIVAVIVVVSAVTVLIARAAQESSRAVVTVEELARSGKERERIRLGARVASAEISYRTQPRLLLEFAVEDIANPGILIPVRYAGARPDTFQVGRDVILEGDFDGKAFEAKTLLTQCPSKYTPPVPNAQSPSTGRGSSND